MVAAEVMVNLSTTDPLDRGRPGFGMHPPVGYAFSPRREQVIELVERLDAVVDSLGQERFADIAAERSCSPAFPVNAMFLFE